MIIENMAFQKVLVGAVWQTTLTARKDAQRYTFGSLSPIVHNWNRAISRQQVYLPNDSFSSLTYPTYLIENKNLW